MNKMMDLKEIIKWFIPCFHILLYKNVKMCKLAYILCLFLFFFARPSCGANDAVVSEPNTKNVVNFNNLNVNNQSDIFNVTNKPMDEAKSLDIDTSVGRTFGRPLKKMVQALIPLAFQIGAASTWMVVAAVVGVKTLLVTLLILKLLLIAGAAKVGALFGQKTHGWHGDHGGHGWEPPHQKEIHLHIHGQGGPHDEHISSWKRDDATASTTDSKSVNLVINPYAAHGPQTISTPYGNYVRIDPPASYVQPLAST